MSAQAPQDTSPHLRAALALFAIGAFLAFFGSVTDARGAVVARGSAEQAYVVGATPGSPVTLLRFGRRVAAQDAGPLGGAIFRRLDPGKGYRVRHGGGLTRRFNVLSERAKPYSNRIYSQLLTPGYGYMRTRDGTRLAINVVLPGPPEDGPYPTLLEYSGYATARPSGPESGIGQIAGLLGYAVVEASMRGTGCSGGGFDYFERLQSLDGYDLIETIARQPWAKFGKVGMLGISYGGISQLFVGATQPPSLAAITPLSVIDNSQTTLYPGGILNTGFAFAWAQDRDEEARAAGPNSGQPYAWEQIQNGDAICARNQILHPEAVNTVGQIRRNATYRPRIADPLSPVTFVDQIKVPTFLACQWTDEQTGGHCPTLASELTGTRRKWITFTNGVHTDSLDPETFNRWFDFLELYVARRRPQLDPGLKAAAPLIYQSVFGINGATLPDDPIQSEPNYAAARAAFERLPDVRILFDNGAGREPFQPYPGFERSFASFPPRRAEPRSWFMTTGGRLINRNRGTGADEFTWNPDARAPTSFTGDTGSGQNGLWTDSPSYNWTQNTPGTALSYRTAPLARDTVVLGDGEVMVWVRSQARNVDLQATVSEVRPDGRETFVQGGWLRTNARRVVRSRSSLGDPFPDFRRSALTTLPRGRFVLVRIPLYYEGHAYRKGSRIRVTVSAPGGDQPIWAFAEAKPESTPWVAIAHRPKHPSRLILPVVAGLRAPTPLPQCPALRGQPCRDYVPLANRPFTNG